MESKKEEIINSIESLLNESLDKRMKDEMNYILENMDDRICFCGHNRNLHDAGEGGSPSICEEENCNCKDYEYNFLISFFLFYQNSYKYALSPNVTMFWNMLRDLGLWKIVKNHLGWN